MRLRAAVISWFLLASLACHGQGLASVNCGEGLSKDECGLATGTVRLALQQLNDPIQDWRWVVVPAYRWAKVSESFERNPASPAFTVLDGRVTYVEDVLIFNSQRIDEGLQLYSRRTGIDRLRWVLAHEAGHIVCNSHSERVAEDAAKRLEARGSLNSVCRVR
jgi:hypothetical protein